MRLLTKHARPVVLVAASLALGSLAVACGANSPVSTHATKPLDPADGSKDYDDVPGGPGDEPPAVPGPEKPTEPSASAMQPGQNVGK